jgi:hypothetical protein
MTFILLHQKGHPILLKLDIINMVYKSKTGKTVIDTSMEGCDLEVDESFDDVFQCLNELVVDVDLYANDG